jgi:hypothetical protein
MNHVAPGAQNLTQQIAEMSAKAIIACVLLLLTSIGAGAQVEMSVPEAGRIKTTAKVENGILGVSNSYTRIRGVARECVGACFYANATKTRVWICRDSESNLDCSGREPVGGC